jgi:single-strand DNA-binding protein
MNIVHLLGRLTGDPETRETPDNKLIARFNIAVQRNKDNSDFFNVTAWEKTAEFVRDYFQKGERIIVHGSIHNANYTDKNGKKQYMVDIIADRLEFADTKTTKEKNKLAEIQNDKQIPLQSQNAVSTENQDTQITPPQTENSSELKFDELNTVKSENSEPF